MTWLHGFSWVRVLALSFNHVLSFVADRPSSVTPTCGKWFSSRSLSCRAFLKLMLTGVMDGTRCCAMAAVQWSSCWEGVICCHATNACVKLIIIIVWPRDEILTDYQIQPSIRAMMAAAKISRSHKIKLMCLVWVLNLKIWYLFLAHSLVNRSECFSFFVCMFSKQIPRFNMLLRWGNKAESNDWLRRAIGNLASHVMAEHSCFEATFSKNMIDTQKSIFKVVKVEVLVLQVKKRLMQHRHQIGAAGAEHGLFSICGPTELNWNCSHLCHLCQFIIDKCSLKAWASIRLNNECLFLSKKSEWCLRHMNQGLVSCSVFAPMLSCFHAFLPMLSCNDSLQTMAFEETKKGDS